MRESIVYPRKHRSGCNVSDVKIKYSVFSPKIMILELPLALIVRENRIIAYNLVNKSLARAKLKVA